MITDPVARAIKITNTESPARVDTGIVPLPGTKVAGTVTIWFDWTSTELDQSLYPASLRLTIWVPGATL